MVDEDDALRAFKRRRGVARDREVEYFHMTMQDALAHDLARHGAAGASVESRSGGRDGAVGVIDGLGRTAGHRPGYVLSADASGIQSSADLHEARKRWLQNRWKRKKRPAPQPWGSERLRGTGGAHPPPLTNAPDGYDDDDHDDDHADAQTRTLDPRAVAEQAYADRCFRLSNAWKGQDR
jgi:hypothetical protein